MVFSMNEFNDELHTLTLSDDGSYTAYSAEYDEHYHSTKDGALHESLVKHVIPALELKKYQDEINILDICFGLGFNTLATLHYVKQQNIKSKINIYSPELDAKLIESLADFTYPEEFEDYKDLIASLVKDGSYKDESIFIELFVGDARFYIKELQNDFFDIVYQDAFSPSSNPILWTKEYFADIAALMKEDAILTTYSTAFKTRLALYENNFNIYINTGENFRNATLASKGKLESYKEVDILHKISCNKDVESLRDAKL